MDDIYTPTKTLDGDNIYRPGHDMNSPAVYVPTPINPSAASTSTPKPEDHTTRSYGAGIRIVKRKPKPKPETSEDHNNTYALNKRRATEDGGEDPAMAALRTHPSKGILRTAHHAPRGLSISFADTKNLPLVHIKEIERIAAIHSSVYDFRSSERNEGADLRHGFDDMEDVEWGLLKVKNARVREWAMTEPAKIEVQRLEDAGIMRGAPFGIYTLKCIPELNDLAASDLAGYKPTTIPTMSVPTDTAKVNALRDLPLPGRNRNPVQKSGYNQDVSAPKEAPVIQQVFQETDPVMENNYYTATTSKEESPPHTSGFELPANLKTMLEQLKKKGILSNKEPAPAPQPEFVDPMAVAMQAAQKMMAEQSACNTYSSEEYTGDDYEYVATFATPEMKAQERRQNSRNLEGWTQSGWKIQEPCVYYINRPHGCNRGDNCRFLHDEELRQKTQAEHAQRGYHREGFRGGDRRGRAGFRNNFHNNRHHSSHHNNGMSHQEHYNSGRRDGHQGGHFQNQESNRGDRYNAQRESYVPRGSRFDKKEELNVNLNRPPPNYNQPPPNYAQQPSDHHQHQQFDRSPNEISDQEVLAAQHSGPSPPKRQRTSRFDRVADTQADVDHRPQRKSRFDDRPHRSRFDQPAL